MFSYQVNNMIYFLKDQNNYTQETQEIIESIFDLLSQIKKDEDGRCEMWLNANRGTYQSYLDAHEYEKDDYEKEWWLEEYPNELCWHHLYCICRDNFQALFVDDKLIYQSSSKQNGFEIDAMEFFEWVRDGIVEIIKKLKLSIYNDDIQKNLNFTKRYGVILRKDYWNIYPELRERLYENLTKGEVLEFLRLIDDQKNEPVGNYIKNMNAKLYYDCCKEGYILCHKEYSLQMSSKDLYMRYGDMRDAGRSEIDELSLEAFLDWFNNEKIEGSGHTWEVIEGSSRSRVHLFLNYDDVKGFSFYLSGNEIFSAEEIVHFYVAIRRLGYAIKLHNKDRMIKYLLEEDYIGIVPSYRFPLYCENHFPNIDVHSFCHLEYERQDEAIKVIKWLNPIKTYLKKYRKHDL